MQLEPRGIGAACGVEAMLAQASGDPDLPLIERMLREHLGALSRNKLPDVARAMSLTLDELQILILRVRALNPRPGAEFVEDGGLPVQPDAFAWIQDGKIRVALDDEALPICRSTATTQRWRVTAGPSAKCVNTCARSCARPETSSRRSSSARRRSRGSCARRWGSSAASSSRGGPRSSRCA